MNVYPNPFAGQLTFRYKLNVPGVVTIQVSDISGRVVYTSTEGAKAPGDYTNVWNSNSLPAGSYIAVLAVDNQQVQTIKIVKSK
jgi:flagellar hook assembly protein FlgD